MTARTQRGSASRPGPTVTVAWNGGPVLVLGQVPLDVPWQSVGTNAAANVTHLSAANALADARATHFRAPLPAQNACCRR